MQYWFAAQQKTSTFSRQKLDPFYLNFREDLNRFTPRVQKQQEEAKRLLRTLCVFRGSYKAFKKTKKDLKLVSLP